MSSFGRRARRSQDRRHSGRFEFLSTKTERGLPVEPLSDEDLGRAIYEIYAVHWGFWNAGLEPADLYVQCAQIQNGDPPGFYANVVLIQDGRQRFLYTVLPIHTSDVERLNTLWLSFCDRQKQMPKVELDSIIERSVFYPQLSRFWVALQTKGIHCPLLATEDEIP